MDGTANTSSRRHLSHSPTFEKKKRNQPTTWRVTPVTQHSRSNSATSTGFLSPTLELSESEAKLVDHLCREKKKKQLYSQRQPYVETLIRNKPEPAVLLADS